MFQIANKRFEPLKKIISFHKRPLHQGKHMKYGIRKCVTLMLVITLGLLPFQAAV